jgi:hypothetical protein
MEPRQAHIHIASRIADSLTLRAKTPPTVMTSPQVGLPKVHIATSLLEHRYSTYHNSTGVQGAQHCRSRHTKPVRHLSASTTPTSSEDFSVSACSWYCSKHQLTDMVLAPGLRYSPMQSPSQNMCPYLHLPSQAMQSTLIEALLLNIRS